MMTLQALDLQDSMCPANDKLLTTGDKKTNAKATARIKIINSPDFWRAIER
jgi:hypothetical protein